MGDLGAGGGGGEIVGPGGGGGLGKGIGGLEGGGGGELVGDLSGGGGEMVGGGGGEAGGGGGEIGGAEFDVVVQPSAAINVRSTVLNPLIWPAGLKARKASTPALDAQSPMSPLGCVLKLSRFVTPLSVEKYAGAPVPVWRNPADLYRYKSMTL
jgi:hypothetical protein